MADVEPSPTDVKKLVAQLLPRFCRSERRLEYSIDGQNYGYAEIDEWRFFYSQAPPASPP